MGVWLIFTIIALVFCKIAGFLSSKTLVAYFHKTVKSDSRLKEISVTHSTAS